MDDIGGLKNITTSSPSPATRRIDFTQYHWYENHYSKKGVTIPRARELVRDNMNQNGLRIDEEDFSLSFQWKGYVHTIDYSSGFIHDLASTPKWLRGLVDNDDIVAILAARFHDPVFAMHWFSYREANRLFYLFILSAIERYRLFKMGEIESCAIEIDDLKQRRWYIRKSEIDINKWVREKKHKARLYRFGVKTPIGLKIYRKNNPETHWMRNFVHYSKVKI